MSEDKPYVTSEIVPALAKITEYKLNGPNYLDWSRKIRVYLRSVEKDDHLTDDPPTDGSPLSLRHPNHRFSLVLKSLLSKMFSVWC